VFGGILRVSEVRVKCRCGMVRTDGMRYGIGQRCGDGARVWRVGCANEDEL